MKKKIVFAWIEIGNGHISPAIAIEESIRKLYPNKYNIQSLDLMHELGCVKLEKQIKKNWFFLIRNPKIGYLAYILSKINGSLSRLILKIIISSYHKYIYSYLISYKPDIIFSTHYINSIAIEHIRKKYKIEVKLINYLCDLNNVHPFWITKGVDYYLTSTEEDKTRAFKQGIRHEKIKVFNYALQTKHNNKTVNLKKKMGINPLFKILLVSFGGEGMGSPEKFIDILIKNNIKLNVIIITGRNELLKVKIENKYRENDSDVQVTTMGFVSNMPEIINISDICFIKPGPSSTMEILIQKKPILFYKPAGMHEKGNIKYVEEKGLGFYIGNNRKRFLIKITDLIYGNLMNSISLNYKNNNINNGSDNIARFVNNVLETELQ